MPPASSKRKSWFQEARMPAAKPVRWTSKTSWRQKLEKVMVPKVVPIPPKWAKRLGKGTLLVPTPLEVDGVIRTVKKGELITVSAIRRYLARKHKADVTCPLTTGIFIRIAAETAEEDARQGRKDVTPYWRVVHDDGRLNPKFPGGASRQAARLRAEGHKIEPGAGKRGPRVLMPHTP
jgi:hypothetical protein